MRRRLARFAASWSSDRLQVRGNQRVWSVAVQLLEYMSIKTLNNLNGFTHQAEHIGTTFKSQSMSDVKFLFLGSIMQLNMWSTVSVTNHIGIHPIAQSSMCMINPFSSLN